MKTRTPVYGLFAVLWTTPGLAADDDHAQAQALHAAHCVNCHGTEVYTSESRAIKDLPGLEHRVRFCEGGLELGWSDEEISGVTRFLNERFYDFDIEKL